MLNDTLIYQSYLLLRAMSGALANLIDEKPGDKRGNPVVPRSYGDVEDVIS